MRTVSSLFSALVLLLVSCQVEEGPTDPIFDPVDTVKNGYRLTYRIAPDSLEVEFTFLNADTWSFTEFALWFGDSSISTSFTDDTTLQHRYDIRLAYTLYLMGRHSSIGSWQRIDSLRIDLAAWHPTREQLVNCDSVAFRIRGWFEITSDGRSFDGTDSVHFTWPIASLGGDELRKEVQLHDSTNGYRTQEEKVSIEVMNDGATLTGIYSYYYEYSSANGGYWESDSRYVSLKKLSFHSEDSEKYVYRITGISAPPRLYCLIETESRFGPSTRYSVVTDVATPSGEIIFYK